MIYELSEVCTLLSNRICSARMSNESYVSTENMVANRGGVRKASSIPISGSVTEHKRGDVLVSNIRPYFKKIWLANRDGGASNDVLVFRPNLDIVDGRYFYYLLASDKFFAYVMASAKGAKMPRGDKAQIMKYPVDLPDMATQRRIADILGTLDDKIELNRQMNETLEQIGQALFRHYFIDNPDAKNWPDAKFGDLVSPRRGKSLTSKLMRPGMVPVVSGGLSPAGHHDEANTVAPVITISASGVNAGYVALWGDNVWSADSSFIDSTMTSYVYYLYCILKNRQKEIYDSQTGSGQPHIYPSHIERLDIKKAPDRLVELFCEMASTMFGMIWDNECENKYLIELRDALFRELIQ